MSRLHCGGTGLVEIGSVRADLPGPLDVAQCAVRMNSGYTLFRPCDQSALPVHLVGTYYFRRK